ncbi:MAG: HAD-IA family hydrolase, partial [Gammaproteobacteria bacterium]|nr:HAD-IA family hydrolase [Gammaproteobacteria bacterium]
LAEPIVTELGLAEHCAVLVGGDCAGHSKPHPAPLELVMARLGAKAAETVYVGDAAKDIIAGQAAGMITVAVSWGYIIPGEDPASWGADYMITKPEELLTL